MDIGAARKWLVVTSLTLIGWYISLLILGPALSLLPLDVDQAWRIGQIVFPVLLGYVTSAALYWVSETTPQPKEKRRDSAQLLALLVFGPFGLVFIISMSSFFAFAWSNRSAAPSGQGMNIDALANSTALAMGILAASTSIVAFKLFSMRGTPHA